MVIGIQCRGVAIGVKNLTLEFRTMFQILSATSFLTQYLKQSSLWTQPVIRVDRSPMHIQTLRPTHAIGLPSGADLQSVGLPETSELSGEGMRWRVVGRFWGNDTISA